MNELHQFGPKMTALPERMQQFVLALVQQGNRNLAEAAKAAGYSSASRNYLRVQGHRLAHDERVKAAIEEETHRLFGPLLPVAIKTVVSLMQNPEVQPSVRLRAATTILDRASLRTVTEQTVPQKDLGDDPAALQEIEQLAEQLEIPLEKLVGRRLAAQLKGSVTQSPVSRSADGVQ
jgi:hypothetical protein